MGRNTRRDASRPNVRKLLMECAISSMVVNFCPRVSWMVLPSAHAQRLPLAKITPTVAALQDTRLSMTRLLVQPQQIACHMLQVPNSASEQKMLRSILTILVGASLTKRMGKSITIQKTNWASEKM